MSVELTQERSAPRKLTPEEVQRSAERLSQFPRSEVTLKPLVQTRKIADAQMQKSIRHLYDESLARRERERSEIARQMQEETVKNSTMTTRRLSRGEQESMVERLYENSVQSKAATLQRLYEEATSHHGLSSRKLKLTEQTEVTDRLYREGMERERNKHIDLFQRFVLDRQRPNARRTEAQLLASADKMTKGEGVTA